MPTYVVILRVKGSRSPRVVLYGVYSESGIDQPVRGDGSRLDKQVQKNAFKGPLLDLGPSSALQLFCRELSVLRPAGAGIATCGFILAVAVQRMAVQLGNHQSARNTLPSSASPILPS